MQPEAGDAARLKDMLEGCRQALLFTRALDASSYADDLKTRYAVERTLEIVGEAASRISESFRAAHPEIPWRRIIGQRHVLAHDYGEVDNIRIWLVVVNHIPELLRQLEILVSKLSTES